MATQDRCVMVNVVLRCDCAAVVEVTVREHEVELVQERGYRCSSCWAGVKAMQQALQYNALEEERP